MITNNNRSFSHTLLMALLISGAVLVAATNPYFGIKVIGVIQKELKKRKWRQLQNDLYHLKRKGFVDMEPNPDGSYIIKTTKTGQKEARKYQLDNLSIETPKKWDQKWRLVVFDIPAKKYKARAALLGKLKKLGFVMLQRSIWAHPFECKSEIAVVARAFEVERYIHQITCHEVSAGDSLRREFEKRNFSILV